MKAFHHKNNTPSNSIQDSIFSHGTRHAFFVKSNSSLPQSFIQTKLSVNQPGDVYEKEADEMADKVVRNANDYSFNSGRESPGAFFNKPSSSVQRKCAECEKEEKEKKLQTKSDTTSPQTAPSSIESSLSSSKGSGSSLPAAVRAEMENSFSADFSGVKVHNDSSAIQMNKDLHAQAFTHGSDIYFNSGKYNTNSNSGKHLLAHELTHVVQQNNHSGQIRKGSNPSFLSLSSSIQQNQIQLEPNDRHDLTSAQLGGNAILEKAFDHETVISTVNHSKGNHVKKLQDALVQLGIELPEGTKEGTYDKGTEDAVKEFQQKASMSEKESDGIVGRKTIGLMDRSLRNNTISPDEDKAEDDLKLTDPKKKSLDEACKGKPIDEACPVPNTNVNTGADDAIKRIDKVIN